jgi:1,4-dihydroxy-2-naphthoyl-CoA synthase
MDRGRPRDLATWPVKYRLVFSPFALSPFALRLLKASFNASEDGLSGLPALT